MTPEDIVCPACKYKNTHEALTCIYCGAPLATTARESKKTDYIGHIQIVPEAITQLLDHPLPQLPAGAFALFVMDMQEPIVVEGHEAVYLGRFGGHAPPASLDLSRYEAEELGVSRTHARISFAEGIYKIEDLASTNGTWLNRVLLAHGKSYELHNGDQILLGHMRLSICLPEQAMRRAVTFTAQHTMTSDTVRLHFLTLNYLETVVSKLLSAIIEVDSICQASRGRAAESVHILSIRSDEGRPLLYISLDKGGEAVRLVRKWVVPWQRAHPIVSYPEEALENNLIVAELNRLASNLLLDANPTLDEKEQQALVERLRSPLFVLATSELELSPLD